MAPNVPLQRTVGSRRSSSAVERNCEPHQREENTMVTQPPSGPSGVSLGRGLAQVASGQRLIIYGILLNLLSLIVKATAGNVAGLAAAIVATVVALVGLFRLASGMGYAVGWRVLLAVLMVIPLIGLITLVVLNSRATKALRAGGYRVGLLGASRRAVSG